LLEKDGVISLDELGDLIPGFVHVNSLKTHGLEYVNKKGLEIFEKSIDEIKKEGREFLLSISDKKSQEIFKIKNHYFTCNKEKIFSHFQRLCYPDKNIPFKLFYTSSKIYRSQNAFISFTQPLHLLQNDSFLKEIVEERFVFFNKNYYKYQSLTKREQQLLGFIADGDNNKTISEKLCISLHTVKTHRKNICRKLDTGRLTDLLRFAHVFLGD
jgi:DNA-binding CsgD family transcriptional regulator